MEDAELKITSSIDEVLRVLDSWGACQVAELLRVRHRKLLDNSYSIDDLIYIRDMCQHPRGLKDIWIETISSDDWLNMLDEVVFLIDDFIEMLKNRQRNKIGTMLQKILFTYIWVYNYI